jgi:hypothetical protein
LTLRQLARLFGVSKSAADRIIDHVGPMLALPPRKRFRKDVVLIVGGTLAPTRDHTVAEQSSTGQPLAGEPSAFPDETEPPARRCERGRVAGVVRRR